MTVYRQLAHRLRIQRGPGVPDKVSERPRAGSRERGWGRYLDSDEVPTLVEFELDDQVNVEALLRSGAIAPWERPTGEVMSGGETSGKRS